MSYIFRNFLIYLLKKYLQFSKSKFTKINLQTYKKMEQIISSKDFNKFQYTQTWAGDHLPTATTI